MAASIHKALTRVLTGPNTTSLVLDLDAGAKYVILSDQHKGAGDQADEFEQCRPAYRSALFHYLRSGYTLVLLGDVEELWENSFREVFSQHGEVIDLEAAFGPQRYYRIWGNHDDTWVKKNVVDRDLRPRLPIGASVGEALRMTVRRGGADLGTMIILHGHQGTLDSDTLAWLARPVLRYIYRPIMQNFFGVGRQSPSSDARLRGEHDREMYAWAAAQRDLVLIAGHTHRPVWAARTHLQQLLRDIEALEQNPRPGDRMWEAELERAKRDAARKCEESPPEYDMEDEKLRPCYFNTGCCKFSDGDITGIEIDGGTLRLVKWADPGSVPAPKPVTLESGQLADFFSEL